jgi:hypothetical protein
MPSSLSLSRQFLVESQSRAIDTCSDVQELRQLAKTLLSAWQQQAEFSEMYGAQALGLQRS